MVPAPKRLVQVVESLVLYSPTYLCRIRRRDHRDGVRRRRERQLLRLVGAEGPADAFRVREEVAAVFELLDRDHPGSGGAWGEDSWQLPAFRGAWRAALDPSWAGDLVLAAEGARLLGGDAAAKVLVARALPDLPEPPRPEEVDPHRLADLENDWVPDQAVGY